MNNLFQKKYLYTNSLKSKFSFMKNLDFNNLLKNKNYILLPKFAAGLLFLEYFSKISFIILKKIGQRKFEDKRLQAKQEKMKYSIFKFGVFSIPHFKKRAKGGEDASFQSPSLLVVADGVGGWNNVGVDPSAYSRRLCDLISKNFTEFQKIREGESNIVIQLNEDFVKNLIIKSVNENLEKGSSTVCVLYMDNFNNTVYSGYLGDSCYLIARPKGIGNFEVIFKSKEQTHGFNIPFQVGIEGDDPKLAITYKHNVIKDDIVILATDGLWDNIEVENILQELNLFSNKMNSITINTIDFAKLLSEKAEEFSYKIDYFSPFARRALEYNKNYKKFRGGKPDDITVIVAQISEHVNKEKTSEIPF